MINNKSKWGCLLLIFCMLATCFPFLPAPAHAAAPHIIADDLVNWSLIHKRSDTLKLRTGATDAEDSTRVARTTASGEYLVYDAGTALQSFTVYGYYNPASQPYDHPQFLVSADGSAFTVFNPTVYDDGGHANLLVYEGSALPAGSRYLKIVYKGGSIAKSPSIGKVVLNGPLSVTPSLAGGIVPYGSKLELTSGPRGAAIYYTLDGTDPRVSPSRKQYTSPLDITKYTQLKAAAQITSDAGVLVTGRVLTQRYVPRRAEDGTAQAFADTYVDTMSTGNGSKTSLIVRKDRGREAYFKFNLSEIALDESSSVKLYFHAYAADPGRNSAQLQLFPVTDEWAEGTLTYKNKPLNTAGQPFLEDQILEYAPAGWLEFDVSYYVQEQKKLGNNTVSFVLSNMTDGTTYVSSRESGFAPFLRVSSGSGDSQGLVDPLEDFKKVAARTNMRLEGADPAYYGGDYQRMVRSTSAPGNLIYNTGHDINSFLFHSYFFSGFVPEPHKVYASPNGVDYTEVPVDQYPSGEAVSGWQHYIYEGSQLPAGTRFLKIEVLGSAKAWSPQLTAVSLNRKTASVSIQTKPAASAMQVELNTASAPAQIFYREGEEAAFKAYSGPISMSGYHVIETYAVKGGLEPSPVRRHTVNASSSRQIDAFGQVISANFPEKVKSVEELKSAAAEDAAFYKSFKAPSGRDVYGGLAGSAVKYGITPSGFFDIRQVGDKQVMVTPQGNLYFSLGMNGITPNETYTNIKGRESLFDWLPGYTSEYKSAFLMSKDYYSFYLANKYRVTGKPFTTPQFYSEALGRIKSWGFNGAGAWSAENLARDNSVPYVAMLPLSKMTWAKVPGVAIFDIFTPNAAEQMEEALAPILTAQKDDPLLIGYFIDNEYDYHKFSITVPKLKASTSPLKARFVKFLEQKYEGDINAFNVAWTTRYRSFEDLREAELTARANTPSALDTEGFLRLYLDTFFGTVERIYRKYDPNHLLLGDRWLTTPSQNPKLRGVLAEVTGKYVDVISINHYSKSIDTVMMHDVHLKSGGKPILLSEFSYGTAEQGLNPITTNTTLTQTDRMLRYRNYVEGAASLGFVVGAHWFDYVDQAATGRYWEGSNAEHYNSGLVNVADRPYKTLIEGVTKTNHEIYDVLLRKRAPFYHSFDSVDAAAAAAAASK